MRHGFRFTLDDERDENENDGLDGGLSHEAWLAGALARLYERLVASGHAEVVPLSAGPDASRAQPTFDPPADVGPGEPASPESGPAGDFGWSAGADFNF